MNETKNTAPLDWHQWLDSWHLERTLTWLLLILTYGTIIYLTPAYPDTWEGHWLDSFISGQLGRIITWLLHNLAPGKETDLTSAYPDTWEDNLIDSCISWHLGRTFTWLLLILTPGKDNYLLDSCIFWHLGRTKFTWLPVYPDTWENIYLTPENPDTLKGHWLDSY